MTKREYARLLGLRRKATVLRRRAFWVWEDAPAEYKSRALILLREAIRVRRKIVWLGWYRTPLFVFSSILKRLYAPAISNFFAKQSPLYEMFVNTNKRQGATTSKGEGYRYRVSIN